MSKKPKKKFYVVWIGRNPGVYDTWDECKEQVHGYPQARYKSFPTIHIAQDAYLNRTDEFVKATYDSATDFSEHESTLIGDPIPESISVDAAWNTKTGVVEYQGVHTLTGEVIFRVGPFEDGTINIVEFLAIVHALAHCKKNGVTVPIYSDSTVAIGWIRQKLHRTNHEKSDKNAKLFELLDRATKWLNENEYENKLLKWETQFWGENPADFGRK